MTTTWLDPRRGPRLTLWLKLIWLLAIAGPSHSADPSAGAKLDYERARWHPIHFSPQIDQAKDEQCLACHREVLSDKPRAASPAGVKADSVLAWYQTLDTYTGAQESFHWRHTLSPYAQQVMNLKCNTCHRGNDPREEAPSPPTKERAAFALRKMVEPQTCLLCHGKFPHELMGLPTSWPESRDAMGNNCMACHAAIRTTRHQVNYLKPEGIEKLGATNGDACYGCHGGRQWYRTGYPYPRHAWPGMPDAVPDWAKGRATESETRFLIGVPAPGAKKDGNGK